MGKARVEKETAKSSSRSWSLAPERRVGRPGSALLLVLILSSPWLLFFDPIAFFRRGHIAHDPLAIYRLYSDDFAYVSASRTLGRTIENLFVPHNTHIVPAWRVLTWALVEWAGSLEKLPEVLAEASYGILAAVMLLTGRFVARETGRTGVGLAAMAAVGTTSVMASSACWYSAGQTLWAGFGILATLWYAQRWRRSPQLAALALAAISAMLAGWFWTIGHIAGPAAAVYLILDGRRRCRLAAVVPVAATVLAVALGMSLGGGKIDSTVSFHGRTTGEAAKPVEGLLHTAQAIPENLVLGNLGLKAQTTQTQGMVLTVVLLGVWFIPRWRHGGPLAFNPLECTGLAVVLGAYLVEWTVRGYMPFRYLRTINLGMIVPWYDTVPQIGAGPVRVGMGRRSTPAWREAGGAWADPAAAPAWRRGSALPGCRPDRAQPAQGGPALAELGAAAAARGAEDVPDPPAPVDAGDVAPARPGRVAEAAPPPARSGPGRRPAAEPEPGLGEGGVRPARHARAPRGV